MAVTGSRDATKCLIGPGWLYINVPIPAANTALTLTMTGGVPTPASGILVGYTKDGNKFTSGFTQTSIEADESKSPLWQQVDAENMTLEGTLMQVNDPPVITTMLPNATYVSASGLWTFGGLVTIPTGAQPSVLLCGLQRPPNDTKWVAAMIYQSMNADAFVLNLTRKAASETTFKFTGLAVGTRPLGDQLGQLVIEP